MDQLEAMRKEIDESITLFKRLKVEALDEIKAERNKTVLKCFEIKK